MVVNFQHIKVLLSGSAAAGKSSFCRLLFRDQFSNEYKSTEVMQAKQAVTVKCYSAFKQQGESEWLELKPENQLKQLKSFLKDRKFHFCSSQPCNLPQEQKHDTVLVQNVSIESHEVVNIEHDVCQPHDDDGKPHDYVNEAHQYASKELTSVENDILCSNCLSDQFELGQTIKQITVFDTGGQPEFVMLFPAINSMPTLNFLVHDLTKKLEDPVLVRYSQEGHRKYRDYFLNYSNLDMIHLLMCFVTDSCDQQHEGYSSRISVPEKPYIGFIGTHFDAVKNNPEVLQNVNEQLRFVVDERKCQLAVIPSQYGVVHPVDNTTAGSYRTEDPAVKTIREKVEDITDDMEVKELPITWMILQLELQDLRDTSNTKYISYEQYKKIAQQNVSIIGEKEVEASLRYFHILGIVLYFSNKELCNWVVIDLPWLFTNLAKIMHLSVEDVRFFDLNFEQKFDKQQLLAKKLLKKIKLPNLKQVEIQYFINLLIYLKVISTVTVEQEVYYYLPCGLPSTMLCHDSCKFLLSEPLLIQFSSSYLPRGFFCSLVALLLNETPNQWKHQLGSTSVRHYSNVITFQLPDETFLRLHDKTYYLEAQVRHYKRDASTQYHSQIFPTLKQKFNDICNQLRFDSNKLQYGFLCHGSIDVGDHIVILDSTEDPLPSELKCNKTPSHKTQLGDFHKVWFNKVN